VSDSRSHPGTDAHDTSAAPLDSDSAQFARTRGPVDRISIDSFGKVREPLRVARHLAGVPSDTDPPSRSFLTSGRGGGNAPHRCNREGADR
jgi:hypothetical protein